MNSEAIIGLLLMLIWFVSSIVSQVRKMNQNRPGSAPREAAPPPVPSQPKPPGAPQPQGRTGAEQALQDIFRQLGLESVDQEPERQVASEHRPTASERTVTAGEHQRTASEHTPSLGEHRHTASEVERVESEHSRTLSEHRGTLSEHLAGDLRRPPMKPMKLPATGQAGRRHYGLARAVKRDLRSGGRALAKAWVLREVLGPPPGLLPPGQDRDL